MVCHRPSFLDLVDTPNVQSSAVAQGQTSNDGEGPGSSESEGVTKVEERGSNGTDEDGEFEPGQEGTFSGQLYLWLNTDRDVNTWLVLV